MGRRSPSASPSTPRREKKRENHTLDERHGPQELVVEWLEGQPSFGSQDRRPKIAEVRRHGGTKEDVRCRGGRKRLISSIEAGLQITERRASWQKVSGKVTKGMSSGATHSRTSNSHKKSTEKIKTKLLDCFNDWVKNCNEAGEIHGRKRPQEEELKECFERHRLSW